MKKLITMAALTIAFAANAQIIKFDPKTGDSKTDQILKDMDAKAQKDQEVFKEEVSVKFGIPKPKIEEMSQTMPPGDIFMAGQTAEITKKPIDEVNKAYAANKDKGWGAIAKELGIKPGSPEFHAMKDKIKAHSKDKSKKEKKEKKDKKGKGKDKEEKGGGKKEEKAGGKGKGKGKD